MLIMSSNSTISSLLLLLVLQFAVKVDLSLTDNPLDIGLTNSCVPFQSSVCSELDYLVPEPVANTSDIIDAYISGTLDRLGVSGECFNGLRDSLCAEAYPRCNQQEGTVNAMVIQNCTQVIGTCQPLQLTDEYCSFSISHASLHQCKRIADFAENSGYVFKRCNSLLTWDTEYVTEWMFNYLVEIDKDLDNLFNQVPNGINENCRIDYIGFRCRSVGRCWDNGNRIELTQNQGNCFSLLNNTLCFSSSLRPIVEPELSCENWPIAAQLPTVATPITELPTPEEDNSTTITTPLPSPHSSTSISVSTATNAIISPTTTQSEPSSADTAHTSGAMSIFVLLTFSLANIL